jgi:hypothetical protein
MCVLGGERLSRDDKARTGHIVVSEKVASSGAQVILRNILTVTQDHSGLNIGMADWKSADDEGGDAQ